MTAACWDGSAERSSLKAFHTAALLRRRRPRAGGSGRRLAEIHAQKGSATICGPTTGPPGPDPGACADRPRGQNPARPLLSGGSP